MEHHLLTPDRRCSDPQEAALGAARAGGDVTGSSTFQEITSLMVSPHTAYAEVSQKVLPNATLPAAVTACRGAGTKLYRDVNPPDVTEPGSGAAGQSSLFSTPSRGQLPLEAPPLPSRKVHYRHPKKRFTNCTRSAESGTSLAQCKTSTIADTMTSSSNVTPWGERSSAAGPGPSAATSTDSYPVAFVSRPVVGRASSGGDYRYLTREDTDGKGCGGGSAAYVGTAGYLAGANPQEGPKSLEVASAGASSAFSTPARQQLPPAMLPPSRNVHHTHPKKRFSSSTRSTDSGTFIESCKPSTLGNTTTTSDFTPWGGRTSATCSGGPSATAASRSIPETFANQPVLGRGGSLSDYWSRARGDTGMVGGVTTGLDSCGGVIAGYAEYEGSNEDKRFSGVKRRFCDGYKGEKANTRRSARKVERVIDAASDVEDESTAPRAVNEVGSMPVRFEEGQGGAESASALPRNVVGSIGPSAAVAAPSPSPDDDIIDLTVEEDEQQQEEVDNNAVEESPYFSDENCDAPIGHAAFEADIAESDIEDGNGGVDDGNINHESGQANAGTGEGVASRKPSPPPRRNRNIWEIGARYRFVRTLGNGSYGEVAQCEDLEEGGFVAIKRILNVFESEVDTKRIYREIFILRHMKHSDIINLKDIILPSDYENFRDLYLVFEFVDTDLYKLIASPQFLTDDHIKLFLYQMLTGLKYVHSTHVIHRDMKPANILLNEDCSLKICDFGLSRVVPEEPPNDPFPSRGGSSSGVAGKRACSPVKQSPHVAGDSGKGKGKGRGTSPANDEPPVQKRTLKRQLTKHVVTRWYRAPELILLQDYNKGVDVWSVGCIFAELLTMQEDSFSSPQERNALFPGKSCFPLSAEKPASYADGLDQLNVIFDVIGTPSADDMKGLGDVSKYLEKLKVKPAVNLREKFKGASPQALELLAMMLRFDPQKRIIVDEALEHPYLASCRSREEEVTAKVPITMEFEDIAMDKATLKRLVFEEVSLYNPNGSSNKRGRSTDEAGESGEGSPKARRLR